MSPLRAAALVLALSAPAVQGQVQGQWDGMDLQTPDPRDIPDPRDEGDPRNGRDPRDVAIEEYGSDFIETLDGAPLFDALWSLGDQFDLARAMQEDPWALLPYIDSHCEEWLSLVEDGALESAKGRAQTREVEEKGRELARIADLSVGDTRFEHYVDTFFGWRGEEIERFRDGQELYDRGASMFQDAVTKEDALEALEPLGQALREAQRLGDTLGQSMTLTLIGQIQASNGQVDQAVQTMREAIDVGREIRDLDAVWSGLELLYANNLLSNEFERAEQVLLEQYQLTLEVGDDESAQQVLQRMVDLDILRENTVSL